jgi:DNA-binding NarL/FixJ family response regulator
MPAMTESNISLTAREQEIRDLLATGLTSKEIGRRLNISDRTVEWHRASILTKSGVRNTVELVRSIFEGKLK